ncbi:PRC-barrel domain-containing protein [Clostridium sp. D2Q-11]|uniref:PRC-barrel domain-containing protein n=1 Tax=Anaeromonas frigoriresistens TaxID=2683708 RepID=A0A942UT29_9FIRM|nr:PRC-barrel domain-containing protein [Anaeromonas frigoriresistens]MBS4538709.1 PRC-barrel domain-containing protein [Anaeromonas frigoriresistens]
MAELNKPINEEEVEDMEKLIKVNDLEGYEVKNLDNDKLGKIEDIVIDYHNGVIAYGILSVGGFLGIGDDLYAIPWRALTLDPKEEKFILDADKEKLKDAPSFKKERWPDMDKREWHTNIHTYYSMQPYWRFAGSMIDQDTQSKDKDPQPRMNDTYL